MERELRSDEVEAQTSVDGSMQIDLFGDNQAQDQQSDRDAMHARVEAQEPSMDDSNEQRRTEMQGLKNQLRTR